MNPTKPAINPARKKKLLEDITLEKDRYKERHKRNDDTSRLIVTLGIILGLSVTAAGLLGYGKAAGILGLLTSVLIYLQNAFYFAEKAEFFQIIYTEAENLLHVLNHRVRFQREFQAVLDAFLTLQTQAARNIPKGQGMDVVKEIYKNLPKELQSK